MLVRPATTRDCERLFRRDLERRGHRFRHYKNRHAPRAALTLVQALSANVNTTPATATVNITPTAGNLLVAFTTYGHDNAQTVTMSTAGASTTWTQTASGYVAVDSAHRAAMFFVPNIPSGITSVSAGWGSNSTRVDLCVFEISGAAAASVEDASVNNVQAAGTTATSGTLVTTNANDILIFGVHIIGAFTAPTAGTGFTIPAGETNLVRSAVQYQIVSSTFNGTTTLSWTTSLASASVFAGFKAAGGAALLTAIPFTPGDGLPAIPQLNSVPL